MAKVAPPREGEYESWKAGILAELRRVTFRHFPERIPPATLLEQVKPHYAKLESEPGIEVHLRSLGGFGVSESAISKSSGDRKRVLMVVRNADSTEYLSDWAIRMRGPGDHVYMCTPRGIGETEWTRKNPPNYVERSHVLLGRTVDTGRVWDIIAAARYMKNTFGKDVPVYVLGEGASAALAAYAALLEPDISGVILNEPPLSHMDDEAPQFLNVLRVCDVPEVLGMLAPRELTVYGAGAEALDEVAEIFAAARASEKFTIE